MMSATVPQSAAVFIALEGIDGSGTTTQLGRLTAHLEARGRRAHATREPSTGPVGRLLRELLLGQHALPDGAPADGQAMALLFAADRRDHLRREVEPLLAGGVDVVSDRYLMSSLAYQAEEADRTWVAGLARAVRPADLTLLLDVSIDVAAARRRAAGRVVERYDDDLIQARVAENYRRLAAVDPSTVVIDGRGSIDEVTAEIAAAVDDLLARRA
ncbi:MAG TPA: dTMP kinase [Polyangia bacterium]|jgi:dTMP kinase|nr:dTMP kinase [Polyangia bacterium]